MITVTDFQNSISFIIVASASLLILIIEVIFPKSAKERSSDVIFYFSVIALLFAISFSFLYINKNILIYNNFIRINTLTVILNTLLLIGSFITVLSSRDYLNQEDINYGEYYSLIFFSLLGMMLMVSANDLITVFIGLELMSVCFYVLAGFMRKKLESNESALKYFLLGAFVTGFLLLGIAFIYGHTGSTNYTAITNQRFFKENFYILGLILVFIAFIFKTGSFPLQMWVPDVYQGSPTIVAGMMSSIGKTAAFGAMITFFSALDIKNIPLLVALVSLFTMIYGNVVALSQSNIKRLLAYSSIAHAGYLMMGFIQINPEHVHAIVFYLISYVLMQLGAFVIIGIAEGKIQSTRLLENSIDGYKGLGKTYPGLASLLTIFLLSLAGIPPLAGFWGKYYIFMSAIKNDFLWLAIVGILLSLIGVYYYIRIILYMWFHSPSYETATKCRSDYAFTAAVIASIGIFAFGFYPEFILKFLRMVG